MGDSFQTCRWNKPTSSNPDHNAPNVVNMCTLPSHVYTETNTNTQIEEEETPQNSPSPPMTQNQSSPQDSNSSRKSQNLVMEATLGAVIAILSMIFLCWACGKIMTWCQRRKRVLVPLDDINIDVNIDLDSTFSGKE